MTEVYKALILARQMHKDAPVLSIREYFDLILKNQDKLND